MSEESLSSELSVMNYKVPVADCFAGDSAGTILNMENWRYVEFIVPRGAALSAAPTFTVQSCDSLNELSVTETAMKFRKSSVADGGVRPTFTAVAAAGYTAAVGDNITDRIVASARDMEDADVGIRLRWVESVNSAVTAGIISVRYGGRFAERLAADLT